MGGASSEFYQTFRKQCFTAFLLLRRYEVLARVFCIPVVCYISLYISGKGSITQFYYHNDYSVSFRVMCGI